MEEKEEPRTELEEVKDDLKIANKWRQTYHDSWIRDHNILMDIERIITKMREEDNASADTMKEKWEEEAKAKKEE